MNKILISLLLVLFLLPTVLSENRINIKSKINSGNNDAYEKNGKMYLTGATIDMGKQSSTIYRGGFRFTNISLPKGSIIEDAKLSLAYNWVSSSSSNIILYGENSDNAKQFQSTSKDITNRARTKGITWTNLVKGSWGAYQTSPNISIIIQEITDRTNWKEGNSIVILGYESSNSIWEAVSYEGTSWNKGLYGAKLQITASAPHQCIESWSCTEWSKCINGSQMRECNDINNCGTTNNKPIEKQDCVCNESWSCTNWGECIPDQESISVSYYVCNETTRTCIQLFIAPKGTQTRICTDLNDCGTENYKPIETLNCTVNLCKDIICNDSELLCSDGFTATCENICNNNTKSCSNCTPDCTGHEDLCMGVVCYDSQLTCPDGFVVKCNNICNNLTGLCSNCVPNCVGHEGNRKPVMVVMDDLQIWWLESVAIAVTNVNIGEGVDILLNVIPYDISASLILSPKLQEWNNNYKNLIEIAEHGYTHDGNEYNMGSMSYSQQKTIIQNGFNSLQLINITPKSFTPPGGDQNSATLQVLGDMGFHTIFDCYIGSISTSQVMALKQCEIWLCNIPHTNGPSCRFDSSSNIINKLNSMINDYGYGVLVFHMQDFSTSSGGVDLNKINQYNQILKDLKNTNKYQFMTAEEYYQLKKL